MSEKKNHNPTDIPVEGSLGLLALGAVGILAWKQKRKETGYAIPHSNFVKKEPEAKKKTDPPKKEDKKK